MSSFRRCFLFPLRLLSMLVQEHSHRTHTAENQYTSASHMAYVALLKKSTGYRAIRDDSKPMKQIGTAETGLGRLASHWPQGPVVSCHCWRRWQMLWIITIILLRLAGKNILFPRLAAVVLLCCSCCCWAEPERLCVTWKAEVERKLIKPEIEAG